MANEDPTPSDPHAVSMDKTPDLVAMRAEAKAKRIEEVKAAVEGSSGMVRALLSAAAKSVGHEEADLIALLRELYPDGVPAEEPKAAAKKAEPEDAEPIRKKK